MGLQETFRAAAQTAIKAVGDVAASAIYEAQSTTSYDASAGTPTTTYASTANVKVVITEFRFAGALGDGPDLDVRIDDRLALVAAKYISGVTPAPQDRVVITGTVWNVINVFTDPAEALWRLQIRRP